MLYPKMNTYRQVLSLDGFWNFTPDREENGELGNWNEGIPSDRQVAVPASWNEQHQDLMYFFGTGWYEREIEVPESFHNKKVFIRIGAANYFTKVWINGAFAGEHEGAHLPFEFEISNYIHYGKANRIVVSVNAAIKADRLPPGNVESEMIVGFKGQYPNNYYDFFPYGGINRPVMLYTVGESYIKDVCINTDISGQKGIVNYSIFFNEAITGALRLEIDSVSISADFVNESVISGKLEIPDAKFWHPESPYLYELSMYLCCNGAEVDKYTQTIGIRTVKIENNKMLINGEPLFLRGFGMHEDFAVLGKGLSHAVIVKDLNLLKWMGANCIRTSHYPYSEEFLNLADKNGLLVIGETPFVGFVKSHYHSKQILDKATGVISEMIARDKNHPCIIAWSLANEGDTMADGADEFYKNLYCHAKSLDSTRPVTLVSCVDIYKDQALKYYDFVSINRYYGWYEQAGQLDKGCEVLEANLDSCHALFGKPVLVTEFGADAVAGMHIDPPEQFSEEYQAEMVSRQYKIIKSKEYTLGAHIWAFADFKTSQTPSRVIVNRKGLFTRDRQPKLAAHTIKAIWKNENN